MSKLDLVNELHRQARKNFIRRKTVMKGINDTLQADLVEMIPYSSQNNGMKYILTVINIFSKKAYARALKNKSKNEVAAAMESILNSLNHPIKHIHVDNGKEFYNDTVQRMLQRRNINLFSTYSTKKAYIVERFNRTLKEKMWKKFSYQGSYKWVKILPKLLEEYNSARHRTLEMCPNAVNKENEQEILNTVYNYKSIISEKSKPKFKIGDKVRLSKYKHIFEKGYTPNWTTEIFSIKKINYTDPITYQLIDYLDNEIKGGVYEDELQLAKYPNLYLVEKIVRKRGNLLYVKWLGFNSTHNSWIDKRNML